MFSTLFLLTNLPVVVTFGLLCLWIPQVSAECQSKETHLLPARLFGVTNKQFIISSTTQSNTILNCQSFQRFRIRVVTSIKTENKDLH